MDPRPSDHSHPLVKYLKQSGIHQIETNVQGEGCRRRSRRPRAVPPRSDCIERLALRFVLLVSSYLRLVFALQPDLDSDRIVHVEDAYIQLLQVWVAEAGEI
jgi:hypothetical protein